MTTTFQNKVAILSRLYRVNDKISYKDTSVSPLSMPLAMLMDFGIVTDINDKVVVLIDSEFDKVLAHYGLQDTGFEYAWQIAPNLPMADIDLPDEDDDE